MLAQPGVEVVFQMHGLLDAPQKFTKEPLNRLIVMSAGSIGCIAAGDLIQPFAWIGFADDKLRLAPDPREKVFPVAPPKPSPV